MMMIFSDILNFVNQNLGTIASIFIPILVSIIIQIKNTKRKQPTYRTKNINLIKDSINKIEKVDILYNRKKINNLSVSKIVIWNSGKDTILRADVATTNKFRIEIDKDYKILEYELLYQEQSANNFKLERLDDNTLEIDFEFFEHKEGIIVQIYHTATTDDVLKVEGKFIDVKKIIKDDSGKKAFAIFSKIFNIPFLDPFFAYIFRKRISVLFLFLVPILLAYTYTQNSSAMIIGFAICTYAFILVSYWFATYMIIKINNLPKCFKLFDGDFFSSTDSNASQNIPSPQ